MVLDRSSLLDAEKVNAGEVTTQVTINSMNMCDPCSRECTVECERGCIWYLVANVGWWCCHPEALEALSNELEMEESVRSDFWTGTGEAALAASRLGSSRTLTGLTKFPNPR